MKTIKAIYNKKYVVRLDERDDGTYSILYGRNASTGPDIKTSETMKDIGVACKLFDIKVQDMEGQ